MSDPKYDLIDFMESGGYTFLGSGTNWKSTEIYTFYNKFDSNRNRIKILKEFNDNMAVLIVTEGEGQILFIIDEKKHESTLLPDYENDRFFQLSTTQDVLTLQNLYDTIDVGQLFKLIHQLLY